MESPLNFPNHYEQYSAGCYDATWTLAYALNNTIAGTGTSKGAKVYKRYNVTVAHELSNKLPLVTDSSYTILCKNNAFFSHAHIKFHFIFHR